MNEDVIEYFKTMAEETGIPYQSLINFYLTLSQRKTDVPALVAEGLTNAQVTQRLHISAN